MPYLERQGIRLFYIRHGEGLPPLVFVHGYACTHEDWHFQIDAFGQRCCVVACDLRGHGASEGEAPHCTIETFAADVHALLTALSLPPAVLIGHSMGCRVVLQTYLEAPSRVAGLVLVDGSRLASGDPASAEATAQAFIQATGYRAAIEALFAGMFLETSDATLKERILQRALAFPEAVGSQLFPRLVGWDAHMLATALARITVPLLVLQSTYVNREHVRVPLRPGETTPWLEMVRQSVPTAQIEIISGVGHFPMLEAPEAVNRAIAAFLATLP